MKNKFLSFLSGALVMLMVFVLPVSALAAGGVLKIEASPINVMVNGEVFQPKDAKGNDALGFVYNGTTYAPLRALAEAYGLEVGYDGSKNLATVNQPSAKVAQPNAQAGDFKSMWTVREKPVTNYGTEKIFTATYNGDLNQGDFKAWWKSMSESEIREGAEALAAEAQSENPGYTVTMYFTYGQYNLGTAYGYEEYQLSNFLGASIWIK